MTFLSQLVLCTSDSVLCPVTQLSCLPKGLCEMSVSVGGGKFNLGKGNLCSLGFWKPPRLAFYIILHVFARAASFVYSLVGYEHEKWVKTTLDGFFGTLWCSGILQTVQMMLLLLFSICIPADILMLSRALVCWASSALEKRQTRCGEQPGGGNACLVQHTAYEVAPHFEIPVNILS